MCYFMIDGRFILLSHFGVVLTVVGLLILLINGYMFNGHLAGLLSFGVIALIPYLHVMSIHAFFKQ